MGNNPFSVLGVPINCSKDIAKSAYRRLASKHHPDRGGDKVTFQQIQVAWDQIEKGYRYVEPPSHPNSNSSTNSNSFGGAQGFWDKFNQQKTRSTPYPNTPQRDTFTQTSSGAIQVTIPATSWNKTARFFYDDREFVIPPGTPNGWVGTIKTTSERMPGQSRHEADKTLKVQVSIKGVPGHNMTITGCPVNSGYFSDYGANDCGLVNLSVDTNAVNLIVGGWIIVPDVFGVEHKIRIPAGFDPSRRLRVSGCGYYKWNAADRKPINERHDLIVEVVPKFIELKNMDAGELANLKQHINSL